MCNESFVLWEENRGNLIFLQNLFITISLKYFSKTRVWAKERRDRLHNAFDELSKTLPCYSESNKLCKIEILTKAALCIKEQQEKLDSLLAPDSKKKDVEGSIFKF